jgi:hypothetical protein
MPNLYRNKCANWKKYKGKRVPKCGCRKCWEAYLKANPDKADPTIPGDTFHTEPTN